MKKILSLALALALVGVFAGCSNDEDNFKRNNY